ncbi:hypothetical protein [Bacillus cereus]|uniref:hypothetical protein n=1 Tax=Bacillus cereus TaxID=1396 RepID=UPI0014448686|nr:hypothetical protein [Bacillus cereus]
MTKELNLLIVEDDKIQIQTYSDQIEFFMEENQDIKIISHVYSNVEEGFAALSNPIYDAAIIDLKLSPGDKSGEGNQIIKQIKDNLRFPVTVMSGYPQDLDAEFQEGHPFIKVYNKDDNLQEIISEIVKIYKVGITNILGKKGKIEEYINNIFWNHLSKNIEFWSEHTEKAVDVEKILLRYTLSHLQEYLDLSDTQEEFEQYFPVEMYVIPPIKKHPFTGDIINKDNKYWIILNPSCDMAQCKAKSVVIAEIESINMPYVEGLKRAIQQGNEQAQPSKDILGKLLTNSGSLKYHFLPSSFEFPGGFINFQKLVSVKYKDIVADYERVASISDRFSKEIIARFSHYYARQGQPDFDIDSLLDKILM